MTPQRCDEITSRFAALRIALAGDFCLDRYLEIDPAREERSIETELPVHNVLRVRAQAGGAGTIASNLAALGVGEVRAIGLTGEDGEGWELRRELARLRGVRLDGLFASAERCTFTYCKPLMLSPNHAPRELSRLDSKNWTPTPIALQQRLAAAVREAARHADALVLLEQTDAPETGVVTRLVREAARAAQSEHPALLVLADSRRGLSDFPPFAFKMNAAELARSAGLDVMLAEDRAMECAAALARKNGRPVFVTLAEQGIIGAAADGSAELVPALPVRGPIDIVGAGDAVTASLTAALSAGATRREAMELAMAAASVVIHQLGTTGSAAVTEMRRLLASAE